MKELQEEFNELVASDRTPGLLKELVKAVQNGNREKAEELRKEIKEIDATKMLYSIMEMYEPTEAEASRWKRYNNMFMYLMELGNETN